jgi:hypothetical protein
MSDPTDERLSSIWGTSSQDVYAVGEGGTLMYFDGVQWEDDSFLVSTYSDITALWGDAVGRVYIALDSGEVMYRPGPHDDCHACDYFKASDTGASTFLHDIWGANSFNVFAVGQGGAILHYADAQSHAYVPFVKR